ncbi:MAG TPA: sigma 54-interacting transcriptional regulator [Pyrinomonadaceae bacterium]|nr:sigma 54-interacting transcriptional regulator [Pyrinomonadaceae bacterium]
MNLYSARAQAQRRAATLLHGLSGRASSWEELDGRQLADDERGDRTSLLLGGATGGVALPTQHNTGLLAAAGTGTLLITNIEKLSPAAQRVLCRIVETGRYTPVGDPFPRPISCRIITVTQKPLVRLVPHFLVEWNLTHTLGNISLPAEQVIEALKEEEVLLETHPSRFAAAS